MQDPISNGLIAVLLGSLVFAGALIAIMVVQSRRYGGLSITRITAFGMLFVHLMALFAYTRLPLPARDQRCTPAPVNLDPLQFLRDIAAEAGGGGPLAILGSRAFLQVALNVLLFMPMGVLLRRLLELPVWLCVTIAAGASILIETTQYTAVFGLFECRWRVADVDDVLANTLGGLIGVALAPLALGWVARARNLQLRRLEPRPVTRRRRLLALLIDAIMTGLIAVAAAISVQLLLYATDRPDYDPPQWAVQLVTAAMPTLLVYLLPGMSAGGATPGERLLWLEPRWQGGRGNRPLRLLRVLVLAGVPAAMLVASELAPALETTSALWALAVVASVLVTPHGVDCLLAGARMADHRVPLDSPQTSRTRSS